MWIWLLGIGASLAAMAIGAALNYTVSRMLRSWGSKRVKRFWHFAKGKEVFVVIPKPQKLPDHDSGLTAEKSLNIHSAVALWLVASHLSAVKAKATIIPSDRELEPHQDTADLVLIGGTLGNEVCMRKCAAIEDRLEFYWFDKLEKGKPRVLRHWHDPKQKYGTKFRPRKGGDNESPPIEKDSGLVLKFENPSRKNSTVVVLAGNYGAGTLAAARATLDDRLLEEACPSKHLPNSIGFIVEGYPLAWDVTRWNLKKGPFAIGENTGSRNERPQS